MYTLSVTHLMCRRTEVTFTTARRCCDVSVIPAPDTKLQTYLLTYLHCERSSHRWENGKNCSMQEEICEEFSQKQDR